MEVETKTKLTSEKTLSDQNGKDNPAWLVPENYYPQPGEYLKTAFVEFKDGTPKFYYTLHKS